MSYQVKYTSGNEIVVTGNLCRVIGPQGQEKFVGNYEQCVRWLKERGCREVRNR